MQMITYRKHETMLGQRLVFCRAAVLNPEFVEFRHNDEADNPQGGLDHSVITGTPISGTRVQGV